MSRIDYRPVYPEAYVQPSQQPKTEMADKVTAAAAARLRRADERSPVATARAVKRARALLATHSVAPGDLDAIAGKAPEDMLADLMRILAAFENHDAMHGADDISMLARVMLEENIRRIESFITGRERDGMGGHDAA